MSTDPDPDPDPDSHYIDQTPDHAHRPGFQHPPHTLTYLQCFLVSNNSTKWRTTFIFSMVSDPGAQAETSCTHARMSGGGRAQGSGFTFQGLGIGAQGLGLKAQGSGLRAQGLGSRVQGPGFRAQGSGLRVQGPHACIRQIMVQGHGSPVQYYSALRTLPLDYQSYPRITNPTPGLPIPPLDS